MTIEEMLVRLKADNKDFKAKMQEAKKTASDTAGKVDKALEGMGKNAGKAAGNSITKTLAKTRALRDEMKKIREQAKQAVGIKPSDVYKQTTADIEKMSAALDKLKAKQAKTGAQLDAVGATGKGLYDQRKALRGRLDALKAEQMEQYGPDPSKSIFANKSKEWKAMQKEIDATQAKIDALSAKLRTVDQKDLQLSDEFDRLQAEIDEATASLDQYKAKRAQMEASGLANSDKPLTKGGAFAMGVSASDAVPPHIKQMVSLMHAVGEATGLAGMSFKDFASKAVSAVGGVVGWLKKLHTGFGKVLSKIPLLNKFSGSLTKMKKGLMTGLGLRGMLRFGAMGYGVMAAVRGMKEGFGNLRQYSAETEQSFASLQSALLTLKNAFAAAFAPILNIVAPILAKVIDWVTGAATAIAHLVAALTGKSTVVVARKAVSGVASGISDTGSAAKGAKKDVEEYKKSLMGFDQINKLDDQNDSGGSGGSGGGGGGAGAAGSMFDTVEVGKDAQGLADMIKEAWANADFTELGRMVGDKLNAALEAIDWDKIKATAGKIGKSIATFLNGFFETPGLFTNIGRTIAEALNTAIEFAYEFVTNFHWDSFGKAIGDGINGFTKYLDTAKAGKAASGFIKGVLDTFINAVETTDWQAVGKKIGDFLVNVDWVGVAKKVGQAIVAAFKAVVSIFDGIGLAILEAIQNYLNKKLGINIDLVGKLKNVDQSELDPKQKILNNSTADVKYTKDSRTTKELDTTARYSGVKDALTKAAKTVDTTAKYSSTSDARSAAQKTLGTTAKYSSVNDARSSAQKRLNTTANINGVKDSRSSSSKKLSFTGVINKIQSSVSKIRRLLGIATGGIYKNGSWKPITAAADGGYFNQGQMFVAREAGPELVGTIGGHTAVMNNEQIVNSVAAGVYKAVAAAMGNGGNTNVNVTLSADAAQMFRIMQEQAQDYTNTTGLAAFPI